MSADSKVLIQLQADTKDINAKLASLGDVLSTISTHTKNIEGLGKTTWAVYATGINQVMELGQKALGVFRDIARVMLQMAEAAGHQEAAEIKLEAAMRAHGVTVLLGTDAAFGPWPGTGCWPGFQEMARAIEILVRWADFTPMDAILAATREAARALRLDHEIGTVAAGKRADLVLLAADPLQDIRALRRAEMVFRDGQLVEDARQPGRADTGGAT